MCDVFAGFLFSGFDGFGFLLAYVGRTVEIKRVPILIELECVWVDVSQMAIGWKSLEEGDDHFFVNPEHLSIQVICFIVSGLHLQIQTRTSTFNQLLLLLLLSLG